MEREPRSSPSGGPPSDSPEARLVERLRRGDETAFDETYELHRAGLFSFLVRASRERALAEELLQETWLRFAQKARTLAPETDLRAWLFTVARNLLRSRLRRDRFGRELLAVLGFGKPAAEASPFDLVAASETERNLEIAIGELPPSLREVVLLAVVERLEPAQVARVLGLRPEAARQRLARARGMLARLLDRANGEPIGERP
ncbi:MAG TPA: sigma-70 family RNA polymerase sigma factor [Polyangiaceae bacterium]